MKGDQAEHVSRCARRWESPPAGTARGRGGRLALAALRLRVEGANPVHEGSRRTSEGSASSSRARGGKGHRRAQKKAGRKFRPAEGPCLELFAIDHLPRNETEAGPPSGHGRLLKPSSRVASVRIVFLSQEANAVLTSEMTAAVLSG